METQADAEVDEATYHRALTPDGRCPICGRTPEACPNSWLYKGVAPTPRKRFVVTFELDESLSSTPAYDMDKQRLTPREKATWLYSLEMHDSVTIVSTEAMP